jgi:hypothetical protein
MRSIKNKIYLPLGLLLLVLIGLFFVIKAFSPKSIEEIKSDALIDKNVAVRGIVGESIQIGSFSGYILKDDTGSIAVVSKELPQEGKYKTARGTLKKLFVYYIDVDD